MKTHILLAGLMRCAVVPLILASAGFLVFPAIPTQAGNGNFVWVRGIGGTAFDYGTSIAVDAAGNVYTTGDFSGTVDFDPGPGTADLMSAGERDIFISKLDSSGKLVWARAMGGTTDDVGNSIAVDAVGNVYTTGSFEGIADFDPGPGTSNLSSAGGTDIFISKLDSGGNFVWGRSFSGTANDWGEDIAVDPAGNVCTTGSFSGTVDFDPGPGTVNRPIAGGTDIFISMLDSDGNYVWVVTMGSTSSDEGFAIAVLAGDIYTAGSFQGTVDFDPGLGFTNLTSLGGRDIFVSKLSSSGNLANLVWARAMGGVSSDTAYAIAVDDTGSVYTTGEFWEGGPVDFDPGPGTANLTSAGEYDTFISKLDSSGNYVWAKALRGLLSTYGYGIIVDTDGNVYTTGSFTGTLDLDPGTGTVNLTSPGGDIGFISKLDSSGRYVWGRAMGGVGTGIAVDLAGSTYVTGSFNGTADFAPGPGAVHLTSAGSDDIFTCKLEDIFSWPMFLPTITGAGK